jgi:hypothetical protein
MTTEATVVANTSETESMIEDLAGYLASGNEAVNDEYAGRVFKDLTATHIKRLHGSAASTVLRSVGKGAEEKVVSCIIGSTKKMLPHDYYVTPGTTSSWNTGTGEPVEISRFPVELKSALVNTSVVFAISAVLDGDGAVDKKSKLLGAAKDRVACHVYSTKSKKYIFMGLLRVVKVVTFEVPVENNGKVAHCMYLFER